MLVWTLGYGAVWPTLGEIDIVVSNPDLLYSDLSLGHVDKSTRGMGWSRRVYKIGLTSECGWALALFSLIQTKLTRGAIWPCDVFAVKRQCQLSLADIHNKRILTHG